MSASTPPFTLVGFDHVVFVVDDLARAGTFYQTVLGCVPGYSYPALGMEQLWCGASLIVLWDITHPGAIGAIPPIKGGRNVDHVSRPAPSRLTPCAPTLRLTASRSSVRRRMAARAALGIQSIFATLSVTCWRSRALQNTPTVAADGA